MFMKTWSFLRAVTIGEKAKLLSLLKLLQMIICQSLNGVSGDCDSYDHELSGDLKQIMYALHRAHSSTCIVSCQLKADSWSFDNCFSPVIK